MKKIYISANDLLLDSYRLGVKVFESGFRPDFIVGVWRGGTPVGIAVQEILSYLGSPSDHIAIRTSSYAGIAKQKKKVKVHGLDYIIQNINYDDQLLLVDDVFDSGNSIDAIFKTLILQKISEWLHLGINQITIPLTTCLIITYMRRMIG